jgi:AraC-like DNA-binding protein
MAPGPTEAVRAWRPEATGIAEVLHARFTEHAYPVHTHDTWTLLIVDDGAVVYDLDRGHHDALATQVTLLPPHVPHDGRAATSHGFRKRVLYLDGAVLGEELIGPAVDTPSLRDPVLRRRLDALHAVLVRPGEDLEADSRFAFVRERLIAHLRSHVDIRRPVVSAPLARRLRELLDARVVEGVSLHEAASLLRSHPSHLVRSFTAAYGLPPHAYLTGRRIDVARRLLVQGRSAARTATEAGFHDQSHLTRHFRRYLGTTPGRFTAR